MIKRLKQIHAAILPGDRQVTYNAFTTMESSGVRAPWWLDNLRPGCPNVSVRSDRGRTRREIRAGRAKVGVQVRIPSPAPESSVIQLVRFEAGNRGKSVGLR